MYNFNGNLIGYMKKQVSIVINIVGLNRATTDGFALHRRTDRKGFVPDGTRI